MAKRINEIIDERYTYIVVGIFLRWNLRIELCSMFGHRCLALTTQYGLVTQHTLSSWVTIVPFFTSLINSMYYSMCTRACATKFHVIMD